MFQERNQEYRLLKGEAMGRINQAEEGRMLREEKLRKHMSPNTERTKFMTPVISIECLQVFSRHSQRRKEWNCRQ